MEMENAVSAPDAGVSMREALGELYDSMEGSSEGAPEGTVIDDLPEGGEVEEIELQDVPEAPAMQAPAHWSAERRELFAQADPAIQKAWIDREQEYERGIQQKAQEAAQYRQAIEPVKQLIQLRGMTETAWIQQMAAYTTALEQDPAGVIRAVAQQYGVELGNLGGNTTESDEFVDPQVKELREQLLSLQRRIDESQQAAQQSQTSAQAQMIEQFRDQKDASGNPAHPHFDVVMDDIMVLAHGYRNAGRQIPPLAELYDRAVRMRPELASQPAQVSDVDRARKARAARSAAVRPVSSVASGETKPLSLKDELRKQWEQMEKGA
jgi:hypothetical protein